MKLHEANLKKVIKFIEKYGAVKEVKIVNSSTIIRHASLPLSIDPCIVREVDLNKAKEFQISFIMGDIKKELGK